MVPASAAYWLPVLLLLLSALAGPAGAQTYLGEPLSPVGNSSSRSRQPRCRSVGWLCPRRVQQQCKFVLEAQRRGAAGVPQDGLLAPDRRRPVASLCSLPHRSAPRSPTLPSSRLCAALAPSSDDDSGGRNDRLQCGTFFHELKPALEACDRALDQSDSCPPECQPVFTVGCS